MAVGFLFISVAMLYAAIVQKVIYDTGPCFEYPGSCEGGRTHTQFTRPNQVNVWIQAPVYFLIAIGEIFAYVSGLEYAYDHSPKDMKALVQAINSLIAGLGSACAMGLTPIAHDPHLVILYSSIACAMGITTVAFWFLFRKYDHAEPTVSDHGVIMETKEE